LPNAQSSAGSVMPQLAIVPKQQEPEISWRTYDRIEPGVYVGYCRAADVYLDSQWKQWVGGAGYIDSEML